MKKAVKNLLLTVIIVMAIVKKKAWWPSTRVKQSEWWANYKLKLVTYTTELEITVDELAAADADEAMFQYLYDCENMINDFKGTLGTYKKNLLKGKIPADIGAPPSFTLPAAPATVNSAMMDRSFTFVKNLKSRDGFTATIGDAFKIIGDDIAPFDPTAYTPAGKAKNTNDYIECKYTKGPFINGVEISSQRGANPDYVVLGRITKTTYQDSRFNLVNGVPEIRQYIIRAFIDDKLIGNPSPPFKTTWISPLPPPPIIDEVVTPTPPETPVPPVV
jgi:hypothetical protein